MKSEYIGKILNRASQTVAAPHKTPAGKTGKVVSGGDLRAKPSKKRG